MALPLGYIHGADIDITFSVLENPVGINFDGDISFTPEYDMEVRHNHQHVENTYVFNNPRATLSFSAFIRSYTLPVAPGTPPTITPLKIGASMALSHCELLNDANSKGFFESGSANNLMQVSCPVTFRMGNHAKMNPTFRIRGFTHPAAPNDIVVTP